MCAFSLNSLLGRSESGKRFGLDEYLALNDISEIAVSPDDAFVAFTLTSRDLEKDEEKTAIWMLPATGGDAVQMTSL